MTARIYARYDDRLETFEGNLALFEIAARPIVLERVR